MYPRPPEKETIKKEIEREKVKFIDTTAIRIMTDLVYETGFEEISNDKAEKIAYKAYELAEILYKQRQEFYKKDE